MPLNGHKGTAFSLVASMRGSFNPTTYQPARCDLTLTRREECGGWHPLLLPRLRPRRRWFDVGLFWCSIEAQPPSLFEGQSQILNPQSQRMHYWKGINDPLMHLVALVRGGQFGGCQSFRAGSEIMSDIRRSVPWMARCPAVRRATRWP